MLAGFGGPSVTHYVGLLSDGPAAFAAIVVIAVAARHAPAGPLRAGWSALAIALALYLVGEIIGVSSWLRGHDPFPGPADAFYSSFYPLLMAAALCLIRAAAVRVPWAHLSLDAAIFVVGFGAFFWYLVIQPAASHAEARSPQAGSESRLSRARLRAAADARRTADRRRRQRRRLARAAAAAGRVHRHVSRRPPVVARQDARLLPAWPAPGRGVSVLLLAAGARRARAAAQQCGAGPRAVGHLGAAGALTALRRHARSVPGARCT